MRGRKNATIAIARPFSRPCPVVCSDYIYKLQLLTRHTAAISMRTKMSTLMAIVFVLVLAQLCQGNRQIEILDGSIPSTIIFAHFDPSHPLTVQRILSSRTGASWMAGDTAMVFEMGTQDRIWWCSDLMQTSGTRLTSNQYTESTMYII